MSRSVGAAEIRPDIHERFQRVVARVDEEIERTWSRIKRAKPEDQAVRWRDEEDELPGG